MRFCCEVKWWRERNNLAVALMNKEDKEALLQTGMGTLSSRWRGGKTLSCSRADEMIIRFSLIVNELHWQWVNFHGVTAANVAWRRAGPPSKNWNKLNANVRFYACSRWNWKMRRLNKCKLWPSSEKNMLSFPSAMLRSSSTVCKAHSVISISKRRAWNITYSIRHESRITTCQIQNQFLGFNLFFSTRLMEHPHPHPTKFAFSFFLPAFQKFTFIPHPLPTVTAWHYFLQFLHFSMQRYNRATSRGCESFPKSCVGGSFLSELHSQESIQHSYFFSPSDVSARYLSS